MKIPLMLILIIAILSCKNKSKFECYYDSLVSLKKDSNYAKILRAAELELPNLHNRHKIKVFRDSSYIDSAIVDDVIFFNQKRDKCLLLILQKTTGDLNLDQVRIIQGTFFNNNWSFTIDRMPDVPEIIYTINKPLQGKLVVNNSFETLSKKGREYVLNSGNVTSSNCRIDFNYWFGE